MNEPQKGAVLPLVAFCLVALLGMAALAIDIALMTLARQRAQNVADAAALAGAQSLAAGGLPSGAATQVVTANNASGSAFGGTTVTTSAVGAVTVAGYVNAQLAFAPAVSYAPQSKDGLVNTLSVPASATAALPNVCGLPAGSPVAPFGVIGDDPTNTDSAIAYVAALLSGTKSVAPGIYQPTSMQVTLTLNGFDSMGALAVHGSFDPLLISAKGVPYFSTISQASDQILSAGQPIPSTTLAYDNTFYTRQYLLARMSGSNTAYSHKYATYDAWFTAGSPVTPTGGAVPEDHLLILPIVSQSVKNKLAPVTILAFAVFFVDQPYPTGTVGNGIALGRIVGLAIPGGTSGTCSGVGAKTTLPRLTQ